MTMSNKSALTLLGNIVILVSLQEILLCNFVIAAQTVSTVTTSRGATVEMSTIREVLRSATTENAARLLYQLDNLNLHFPDGSLAQLSKLTAITETRTMGKSSVFVDGIEKDVAPSTFTIRKGNGFTVIMDDDSFVHGVWGPSLALAPLHAERHPGLMVNVEQSARNKLDVSKHSTKQGEPIVFENDEVFPPVDPYEPNRAETSPLPPAAKCSALNVCRTVRIAAAADYGLCDRFRSSRNPFKRSLAYIQSRVLLSNDPYLAQTCLSLSVESLEMQCDANEVDLFGSFPRSDGIDVLYDFQKVWNNNERLSNITRDLAMFFPNYYDYTATAGVAFTGAICVKAWSYAWAEGFDPTIIVHEIGHLFSARHSETGIMQAVLYPGTPLLFAADSLESIFARADYAVEIYPDCLPLCGGASSPSPANTPTSSPSPSKSSVAIPTPAPSLSKSPAPSQSGRTCSSGFDELRSIDCAKLFYGSKVVSDMKLVLRVIQKMDAFLLKVRVKPRGSRITSLSYAVSMTDRLFDEALRNVNLKTGGQAGKTIKINPFTLEMPFGSSTCCGNPISVRLVATVCNSANACSSGSWIYTKNMVCRSCSSVNRVCSC